ncbi:MAG: hypothetical protein JXA77_06885 [Bacteroidales bacterium]|nr:hypothetical protein [Bacteroidales bacterium]MBN2819861.1 hypothetical protein [Bacteroidales bacterium]
MKKIFILLISAIVFLSCKSGDPDKKSETEGKFNIKKDLILMHFDCKTDVDDLHSAAGLITLLSHADYDRVKYHAVAGTYGTQEGLYVPPNDLFQLAFGNNWTDAHNNFESAAEKVKAIALKSLKSGGDVWIAEAGQSDFSAILVKSLMKDIPDLNLSERIHIVQHSNWNEEVTSTESLEFVKEHTDYQKIPDGNATGNGTPGFRTPGYSGWKDKITNDKLFQVWQLAVDIGNRYNGSEDRYNNEAVADGGLDFSDLSEVCWILGLQDINGTEEFFERFAQ